MAQRYGTTQTASAGYTGWACVPGRSCLRRAVSLCRVPKPFAGRAVARNVFHLAQSGVTSVQVTDTDSGGDGDTAHVPKHLGPRDWAGTRGRYSDADDYIETMAKGVAAELAGL